MWRSSLAFWFTLATLLAPGACCCSFAAPLLAQKAAPTANPIKSCCRTEAPPPDESGHRSSGSNKPSKCPCKHDKRVASGPVIETADPAVQNRTIDAPFVEVLAALAIGSREVAAADPPTPAHTLFGRQLLAVYSRLRC